MSLGRRSSSRRSEKVSLPFLFLFRLLAFRLVPRLLLQVFTQSVAVVRFVLAPSRSVALRDFGCFSHVFCARSLTARASPPFFCVRSASLCFPLRWGLLLRRTPARSLSSFHSGAVALRVRPSPFCAVGRALRLD